MSPAETDVPVVDRESLENMPDKIELIDEHLTGGLGHKMAMAIVPVVFACW